MMKKPSRSAIYVMAVCVFLLTVNVVLGFVLMRQSDKAMRTLIENRMLDVSNTAAAMLDGDAMAGLKAGDEDTDDYQTIYRTLSYFQNNFALEYIYCVRDLGGGNFVFLVDPSDVPGEFGEPVAYTDALYQASLGTASVDKEPYGDRWGRFYSAYTPVYDSGNSVAGIVAVDFSADWYEQQISGQVKTTVVITAVSLVIAMSVVAVITARFRRRFRVLLGEMNSISDEIETLVRELSPGADINLRGEEERTFSRDEITELGNQIRSLESQLGRRLSYVRSQAYLDSLTGLGNRTAYEEYVSGLDEKIRGGTARFALIIFDMNGLKEINDKYGHEQGDGAITELGHALRRHFEDARLYRIGGDEFAVIVEQSLGDIGERLDRVEKDLEFGASKGCAVFSPDTDTGYRDVFKRADNAMYEDKKAYYLTHEDRRRTVEA